MDVWTIFIDPVSMIPESIFLVICKSQNGELGNGLMGINVNAGNQGGNAVNQGENAGNKGGNTGNVGGNRGIGVGIGE